MEVLEVKNTVTERKIDQKNSVVDFNKHLKTNKQTNKENNNPLYGKDLFNITKH